jgi:hypothetical protein
MIVGISGFIGCGKSTVADQLTNEYGFRKDSFAASLKDACAVLFDWPRHLLEGDTKESREWREQIDIWWAEKLDIDTFSPRMALQLIGTDSLRNYFHPGIWFMTVENRIRKNPNQSVVISDVRFQNEIQFIKDQNGILITVNRGPTPVWYETALMANKGNSLAKEAMAKTYSSAHASEWSWIGAKYDYVINNNDTLEALNSQIAEIITKIS